MAEYEYRRGPLKIQRDTYGITRMPFRITRWMWTVTSDDGFSGGWAATKRGARRAAGKSLMARLEARRG